MSKSLLLSSEKRTESKLWITSRYNKCINSSVEKLWKKSINTQPALLSHKMHLAQNQTTWSVWKPADFPAPIEREMKATVRHNATISSAILQKHFDQSSWIYEHCNKPVAPIKKHSLIMREFHLKFKFVFCILVCPLSVFVLVSCEWDKNVYMWIVHYHAMFCFIYGT